MCFFHLKDYTLWPFWVDTHVCAPFHRAEGWVSGLSWSELENRWPSQLSKTIVLCQYTYRPNAEMYFCGLILKLTFITFIQTLLATVPVTVVSDVLACCLLVSCCMSFSSGGVLDARGDPVTLYRETVKVLSSIHSQGITIGVASRYVSRNSCHIRYADTTVSLTEWMCYFSFVSFQDVFDDIICNRIVNQPFYPLIF